jgi:hypothetical protein
MPHLEELVVAAAMETHALSHGNATDSSNASDDGDATLRGPRPGKRPHAELADRPVRTPTYLLRKVREGVVHWIWLGINARVSCP